jgi:hypothetical protein
MIDMHKSNFDTELRGDPRQRRSERQGITSAGETNSQPIRRCNVDVA